MKSPLLFLVGGSAALVALTAGCQLLLPSEDDGSTSAGGGGARTSSSSGVTTKATTTGKGASSSSGDASNSSSSGTADTTTIASSSSGEPCIAGVGCATMPPTFDACPSPQLCPAIGSNDYCDNYCRSVTQECGNANAQFADPSLCCAACEYVRAHPGLDNACCRAEALNQDDPLGSQSCTVAGPMGTHSNTGGDACGTQAQHVCGLFNKLCANILDEDCIMTNRCMQNFSDNVAEVYSASGTGPMTATMQHLVKAVSDAPDVTMECEAAALFACAQIPTQSGPTSSSATGVMP